MTKKLSLSVKKLLLNKIKDKYKKAKKKDKAFIIDDVVELTNYKRKYAIHQLNNIKETTSKKKREGNNKKYTEEIKEALVKVWYASNRICSKRLAGFLPEMVQIMHDKNHLNLEDKNKKLLASAWIKSSNSREIEGLSGTIKNEDFGVITISKKYE